MNKSLKGSGFCSAAEEPDSGKCDRCDGCGQLANDDDATPWKYWAELPSPSNLAVVAGIVKPITCPECNGSGMG